MALTLVCLSDTHGFHDKVQVPDGDVLIHAGDYSRQGTPADVEAFGRWLGRQKHRHIIVVPGNHDLYHEEQPERAKFTMLGAANRRRIHVLLDDEVTIDGVRFWGAPWTPFFHDWAFNVKRGKDLREKWAKIPEGVDVVVTHGPPWCRGDMVVRKGLATENAGDVELRDRLWEVKPRLHVCGHIHEGAGIIKADNMVYVNASVLNERYELAHKPTVVVIPDPSPGQSAP